ncbi:hypothetical protein [Vibrio coralliilyticus]|uniref:Uncharacterized protein n=1 Tax=Vibrio coralliilyticus TaxID=190893 RepID=A0AAP7DGN4_9VIBR|nr:hypothetical protein [Vibrio coralliilyticus]NOJ26332.1 hypothetical protein [Vibrio coralliilyticus]
MSDEKHWKFLNEYWRTMGMKPKRKQRERLKQKYAVKLRSPMRAAFELKGLDIDASLAERQHRKTNRRKK